MNIINIIIICLVILNATFAFSEKIEGQIESKNNQVSLKLKANNQIYLLKTKDQVLSLALPQLNPGDLINGEGEIDHQNKSIQLQILNFIGLKKLLGLWVSENSDTYNFTDYSKLNLYYNKNNLYVPPHRQFDYRISLSESSIWSILFIDSESVINGQLKFSDDELLIEIYNETRSPTVKKIKLRPLHLLR